MQVTKTVKETRDLIKNWKREGKTIGLVPTMDSCTKDTQV